jgi:dTDP-4-amino-4,6-dideoxygalactose transaminase
MQEWPVSTDLIRRTVAIPIFIRMSGEQIEHLTSAIAWAVEGAVRGGP